MKVFKHSQFLCLKGHFTVWLWPAIYISYTKGLTFYPTLLAKSYGHY